MNDLTRDVTLACLVFAALRIAAVAGRPIVRWPDSDSYFHLDFLGRAGARSWTVPLVFTALPSDRARVLGQVLVGIACWSALAMALARSVRHPVAARFGAALALLLGLCVQVTEWDQTILSESLSLSLTALLAALLLGSRQRRTSPAVVGLLIVLTLWIFTRQLQAIVYIPVAAVVVVWIALRARRHAVVAAVLVVLAVWSGYALSQDTRHLYYGAHDIASIRILQTADGPAYLASKHMPDLAALEKESAQQAATDVYVGANSKVYQDPVWRRWVDRHWTATFVGWLLRHPVWAFRQPLSDAASLLDDFPSYASPRMVLPGPVQDIVWERTTGGILFLIGLALLLWLASLRSGRPGRLDALAGAGLASCVIWYFAAWHLQASELPRLMIPVAAAVRIALVALLIASLDRVLLKRGAAA
jgi:hypothetical protein